MYLGQFHQQVAQYSRPKVRMVGMAPVTTIEAIIGTEPR